MAVRDDGNAHAPSFALDERGLLAPDALEVFREHIWERGRALYRDLPWRRTRDPYAVLVSEVMLQQTQVSRVDGRWQRWMGRFPDVHACASAPMADVLDEWQGLGYNRRAKALHDACAQCERLHGGRLPSGFDELVSLPGVGPATAAGVRAFAFGEPGVYLETNVRTVMLHDLFFGQAGIPDAALKPIVAQTCDDADPRGWYYAMLDYGADLKAKVPNPSRASAHHTRQSRFEGSHRQRRAIVLRMLLDAARAGDAPLSTERVAEGLADHEREAGRPKPQEGEAQRVLAELAADGMAERLPGHGWRIASG